MSLSWDDEIGVASATYKYTLVYFRKRKVVGALWMDIKTVSWQMNDNILNKNTLSILARSGQKIESIQSPWPLSLSLPLPVFRLIC